MIPVLAGAGQRVIAPDLVGFGRRDKPARVTDYSYARHVAWLRAFVETLDLRGVTLDLPGLGRAPRAARRRRGPGAIRARRRLEHRAARCARHPRERGRRAARDVRALPVPQTMLEVAKGFASAGSGGAPPFMHWQKHARSRRTSRHRT